MIDILKTKFGKLAPVELLGTDGKYRRIWKCKCDCGNDSIIREDHLTSSKTISCGCERGKSGIIKGKFNSSFNAMYKSYKTRIERKGLEFNLSKDQFYHIIKQKCHYCNIEPMQIYVQSNSALPVSYNGIDRVDSSLGYVIENCVPCCKTCNYAKRDMSYSDFLSWIERVFDNINKNGFVKCT